MANRLLIIAMLFIAIPLTPSARAQQEADSGDKKIINIKGQAADDDISRRIASILDASEWFTGVRVTSNSGIVTLHGATDRSTHKEWAEDIAYRTENVVAVVNKIQVKNQSPWSLTPLVEQTNSLIEKGIRLVPVLMISGFILLSALYLSRKVAAAARRVLQHRIDSTMLRRLVARLISIPILIFAIYLVFNVSGLGSLASTIIGGTGLIGLIIGIAFRDITENFLASILLSLQRPFVLGDMVQVLHYTGMVQAMTTRGTVIMTLDGNHVQIPNTIIYKEPITNLSANPNIRQNFTVGIGYDASISHVQTLILQLLKEHEAVLIDPEPLVLAEALAASTVNMGIYFWVDAKKHSVLKVRSSVMRQVKLRLQQEGISMPDDAREIIFPQGVQIHMENKNQNPSKQAITPTVQPPADVKNHVSADGRLTTEAEGDLTSEETVLIQQTKNGVLGHNKTNLLKAE